MPLASYNCRYNNEKEFLFCAYRYKKKYATKYKKKLYAPLPTYEKRSGEKYINKQ